MPTLSQYIMQVDQQNKQNAQQLIQQIMPLQQSMLQNRANYENAQAKKALEQEKRAYEEQKRLQGLQDKMTMANYQANLGVQTYATKEKIKANAPLTPYQKIETGQRQQQIELAKEKQASSGEEKPKTITANQKAISTAQSNYTKANNDLNNFKSSQMVSKLQGGYLNITGNDGKLYIFDPNRQKYYKSSGYGEPIKKEVDEKLVLSKETGLAKKVNDYLTLESKAIQAGKEYNAIKSGKNTTQPQQKNPQQQITNWDQFKG